MNVLLSAYACEPDKGSEPGVGWNCACQIARFHNVWVLTRTKNRKAIEAELRVRPHPNAHFIYYDLPRWASFWKKERRGVHVYYHLWQMGACAVARRLHRQVNFQLVHHVTFVNYWMPTFMPVLPVPLVWGPVGGADSAPLAFWRTYSLRGKVYEFFRTLGRYIGELHPAVRVTARRAAVALATTPSTAKRLRRLGCRQVSLLSQVGLSQQEFQSLSRQRARRSGGFRVISVGSLLHLKGLDLALRAFARFRALHENPGEYWIVGSGPELNRLKGLATALGMNGAVKFWGELKRPDVFEKLLQSDVLLHTALHDSGGLACAEAMAASCAVVCLDLAGSSLQVTEDTGIKIPAVSPDQAVGEMAEALDRLARDAPLRQRMGDAGRERVREHFGWDSKGTVLREICNTFATDGPCAALDSVPDLQGL